MTLLGKLLILFNLLVAGGFVYLATQDWTGRQNITAAAVRHKLLLVGLPVKGPDNFSPDDETPFRIEMAGSAHTETISKKILDTYFKSATGGDNPNFLGANTPVPNQLAEVKRVKARIVDILSKAGDADKVQLLGDWLIDQSLTFEQRQEVQNLVKDGNAAELEKRLMALFEAILNQPEPERSPPALSLNITDASVNALRDDALAPAEAQAKLALLKNKPFTQEELEKELANDPILQPYQAHIVNYAIMARLNDNRIKPLDESERQYRIAHLLIFLSPFDNNWQKRVVLVVGIRRYVTAITGQTVRLKDMYTRLERLIIADQKAFIAQERTNNQLARDRTELANRQSKLKAELIEAKAKEDDFVAQKQTQLDNIKKQLEKVKAEVDELLAKQGLLEAGLFEVQREVAITLDEVYQLEIVLAEREREILKLSPLPK